ncbi:hypothetical protein GMB80_13740 [Turicibacter sanguinis]|nr:hypothetical protein [Turicibacter sanguinis]
MANETTAQGVTLKLADTAVKGLKSTGEITETRSKIEVTDLSDDGQRFINGIKQYGDSISYTCNYEKAEFLRIRALDDGTPKAVEIKYKDGLTLTFDAYVEVTLSGNEVDSVREFTFGLTPASAIVIADGE